ncbi:hypothetical protein QFZ68_007753 [Streptomyces sp. V1I6]|nr:hypothetical protein [Streptomyces sp. V1I6]
MLEGRSGPGESADQPSEFGQGEGYELGGSSPRSHGTYTFATTPAASSGSPPPAQGSAAPGATAPDFVLTTADDQPNPVVMTETSEAQVEQSPRTWTQGGRGVGRASSAGGPHVTTATDLVSGYVDALNAAGETKRAAIPALVQLAACSAWSVRTGPAVAVKSARTSAAATEQAIRLAPSVQTTPHPLRTPVRSPSGPAGTDLQHHLPAVAPGNGGRSFHVHGAAGRSSGSHPWRGAGTGVE